jgi:CRP-like cAMP-binding protein
MPTDIQTLKSLDLFGELTSEELQQVAAIIHPMRVSEGEILTQRGEPAQMFYVVLKGNFMISFKEGRAFTLHEQGDIIGWSTIVTPFRYTGTAVALTDGEVLTLQGDDFLQVIQGESSIGDKIMNKINPIIAERVPYFSRDRARSPHA